MFSVTIFVKEYENPCLIYRLQAKTGKIGVGEFQNASISESCMTHWLQVWQQPASQNVCFPFLFRKEKYCKDSPSYTV